MGEPGSGGIFRIFNVAYIAFLIYRVCMSDFLAASKLNFIFNTHQLLDRAIMIMGRGLIAGTVSTNGVITNDQFFPLFWIRTCQTAYLCARSVLCFVKKYKIYAKKNETSQRFGSKLMADPIAPVRCKFGPLNIVTFHFNK